MNWDEILKHPGTGREGALRLKHFHTDAGRWTLREEHGRYLYLIDPNDKQVGMANLTTGFWHAAPVGGTHRGYREKARAISHLLKSAGLSGE